MKDMLEKLMAKKKPMKLDEDYKSAKMDTLKSLHEEMTKMMGDDVRGLKKVTVAAPDAKGLKMGLEKAEDMMESKMPEMEEMASEESEEEEEGEEEAMSLEEIEEKMAELQKLKEKLAMKA